MPESAQPQPQPGKSTQPKSARGGSDRLFAVCLGLIAVGMLLGPVAAMSGNSLILDAAAALVVVGFFSALGVLIRSYIRSR